MRPALAIVAMLLLAGCGTPSDDADRPQVRFETSLGDFTVELWPDKAPVTVENFLQYVDDGFYDGLTFHRIAPGFVVQGGGFLPDHETRRETRDPIVNEAREDVPNEKWTLSMARTSAPDSATSQFFINLEDNPALDKNPNSAGYAVFGRVIAGYETIEAMTEVEPGQSFGAGGFYPKEPIVIESATRVSGIASSSPAAPPPPPPPFACPEGAATPDGTVTADLITPGVWCVTNAEDRVFAWVHNNGNGSVDMRFDMTGPDGGALPEGWTVTFDAPSHALQPVGSKDTSGGRPQYTDWAYSMATIHVPEGTSGEHQLELHTGPSTTPIMAHVDLRHDEVTMEGDDIKAAYRGTFTDNGEEFDSGEFPLTLGQGRAITGFDLGLVGLGEQESATLVLPAAYAYGYDNAPREEFIGRSLTFEVTVLEV